MAEILRPIAWGMAYYMQIDFMTAYLPPVGGGWIPVARRGGKQCRYEKQ